MATPFNFYDLLGIKSTASLDEISRAYRDNVRKYHPDHNSAPNANQLTAMLNDAWETLRDPVRRAEYDRSLGGRRGQSTGPDTSGNQEAKKEEEWKRQREEAERRRKDEEAARKRHDEAARQRVAEEQQRKAAEEAQRQRESVEKAARAKEKERAETAAKVADRKRLAVQVIGLLVIIGVIAALQPGNVKSILSLLPSVRPSPTDASPGSVFAREPCLPKWADVAHPHATKLSDSQMKELARSYTAPEVLGLRHSLDAFRAGRADSETETQMQPWPDLAADHFTLLNDEQNQFGGAVLRLRFTEHPDGEYITWVYPLGGSSTWAIRTFDKLSCTPAQLRWIALDTQGAGDDRLAARSAVSEPKGSKRSVAASPTTSPIPERPTTAPARAPKRLSDAEAAKAAAANPPGSGSVVVDSNATTQTSSTSQSASGCEDLSIVRVADDGASIEVSDGRAYRVSERLMKVEASGWSTGDRVTVCRSGDAASIENPAHYAKIQAEYERSSGSASVRCGQATIVRVADEGAVVEVSDGGSYRVDQRLMKVEASGWSTGDQVTVCRSGNAASIENPAHYAKVQAEYGGRSSSTLVHCGRWVINRVADDGATIDVSDGGSYRVEERLMKVESSGWSTGDKVSVCRSGNAASIENPAHYAKVQATRI
jgi:DnaJ domain